MGVLDVNAKAKQIINVPNLFTAARLVLAIVVFVLVPWHCYWASFVVFVIAASTDWIDGYWARRFNQVTQVGRVFDPFVDKIIVCGLFIFLAAEQPKSGISAWMAVVIVGREMLVTALRSAIEQAGGDFSAKLSGKLKMVFQCIAIGASLVALTYGNEATPAWLAGTVLVAVWLAVLSTIWSGVQYVFVATKFMSE
jgi:CDP-diacylglycerol---glycerol-3-phosphate 3-phosphatidyltransferase